MPHTRALQAEELSPELRARLDADASSMMRYFLDLAGTVQEAATALRTESEGGLSCFHPALQADRLEVVARHLRTFAVHPDCTALDAMAGPPPTPRKPLEVDSNGSPIPPWRTREDHEGRARAIR